MSANDTIPAREAWEAEMAEDEAEWLEWVAESIDDVAAAEAERRRYHDRTGHYLERVGGPQCTALGHPSAPSFDRPHADAPEGLEQEATWEEWAERYEHREFDGDWWCEQTDAGPCCSECATNEYSDCPYDPPVDVWSLPGVRAA